MKNKKQTTFISAKIPRPPTAEEKRQFGDFLFQDIARRSTIPTETIQSAVEDIIADAYIAVFDEYKTITVEYAGKIMVVLYNDMPMHVECFIWGSDGHLIQIVRAS